MTEEQIKQLAKEEFIKNLKENLDSTLIYTYISELEKENQRLNNIIQSINSVCSSMQFSAPENMYVFLPRMIEVLDKWKKEKKND